MFHGLKLGQERVYDKLFLLKGEYVYIAGAMLKNSDGVPELQILICYNRPEAAVATYKQRWQIETCFYAKLILMESRSYTYSEICLRYNIFSQLLSIITFHNYIGVTTIKNTPMKKLQ